MSPRKLAVAAALGVGFLGKTTHVVAFEEMPGFGFQSTAGQSACWVSTGSAIQNVCTSGGAKNVNIPVHYDGIGLAYTWNVTVWATAPAGPSVQCDLYVVSDDGTPPVKSTGWFTVSTTGTLVSLVTAPYSFAAGYLQCSVPSTGTVGPVQVFLTI